jgi:hypothetical protein
MGRPPRSTVPARAARPGPGPTPGPAGGGWVVCLLVAVLASGAGVAPPTAVAGDDSLRQSRDRLRDFPFQPDCGGNTQEMVACLWERRNQGDAALEGLLGSSTPLEPWRSSRRSVCRQAARKAQGGSLHPIVWLSCENALNRELLRQIRRPLTESADL